MTVRIFSLLTLAAALLCPCGAECANPLSYFLSLFAQRPSWDCNRDGAIRITLLAPEELGGNVRASHIAADLERIIAAENNLPVHVFHERIDSESIMGWFYNPKNADARAGLADGLSDMLLIAERSSVISQYPEFHFEGVRAVADAAKKKNIRCMLLNTANPARSFRDRSTQKNTEIAYRIGDGCGIDTVPVAPAWITTLKLNRLRGDSPSNARAYAFLAAACVRSAFDGKTKIADSAFSSDWTTAPLLRELAASAFESAAEERSTIHYRGPFQGVIAVNAKEPQALAIFAPSGNSDDPVRRNLDALLSAAGITAVWRSPDNWYRNGDDFYDTSFDLVFGDTIQIERLLNPMRFSSLYAPPKNIDMPVLAMYTPISAANAGTIADTLESSLFAGYDYAREHGIRYIPLPLAWAKICHAAPEIAKSPDGSDWPTCMLADMLYTAMTGRYQAVDTATQPSATMQHPDMRVRCAQIGHDTMIGLSSLQDRENALITRCENLVAVTNRSLTAAIRLRDRPSSPVKVLCAIDNIQAATLSKPELLFTPEDYNIEQQVEISAAEGEAPGAVLFIIRSESEDRHINNQSAMHRVVFNFDKKPGRSVRFAEPSLPTNAVTTLIADAQPAFPVFAKITQNGLPPQTKILAPDDLAGIPVAFHPTAEDYRKGAINVTVELKSEDPRFDSSTSQHRLTLAGRPSHFPQLESLTPEGKCVIGPAFVEIAAKWSSAKELAQTSIFLGRRKIGDSKGNACTAAAETAAPPSRLPPGKYTIWSETITSDMFPVASRTFELSVSESKGEQ